VSAAHPAPELSPPAAGGDLFARGRLETPRLAEFRAVDELGLLPWFRTMASQSGPVVVHDGREVVMLGSNNYLGLTSDERVKRAATDAVERYGSGCTGSRLMNGTLPLHHELEEELADWLGGEASLVFTTGYAANLGTISALAGAGDAVFVDADSHASIIDGARLSQATLRYFRHNSPQSLKRRLGLWLDKNPGGVALAAIDSLYSMSGEVAPVVEIADVCEEFGVRLLVDEAHAIGVLGPRGAGIAAAAGVRADLLVGTFSKSLASCGGFVVGPKAVIDYLRISSRPFLFAAAGVPAAMAAALAALRIARDEDWRREAAQARADQLRRGLAELGYGVDPAGATPIIAVPVGDDWAAVRLWRGLLDRGVYTNCAVSPAVPRALLRTSVMATHSEEQVDAALEAFAALRSTLD
jgi:8-amino-7-oxononanoate synthase